MEVRNPFLDMTDVEYLGQTRLAKVITCKKCGEVVYRVTDNPTQSEISIELAGLRAHFELQHNISILMLGCSDPNCIHEHR
jgi:hypothetical protein